MKLLNSQSSKKNPKKVKEEEESEFVIRNSDFSINNDEKKKKNINESNKIMDSNNNIYTKDISMISNFGIKCCKSLTQAGKERTGHRKKNQDNYIIEKNINKVLEFNIFAVLDGHGDNGHMVSQLASKYLIKKISTITSIYSDIETIYNFLKKSDFKEIIKIFLEIDKEIIEQQKFDIMRSGSTCVLIIQLGVHIICANIGDSRAILVYEEHCISKIFELSHDSKPELPEEKKRIIRMGGLVQQVKNEKGEGIGPFRVYDKTSEQPGLAMSRSFGDKKGKMCGVISYPEIIEYNLNNHDSKYMVICSDGVWEILSNEEVMNIGNNYYKENNISEFCNNLLKTTTKIWEEEENYMDDITILVVFF